MDDYEFLDNIEEDSFDNLLSERYLSYAMSTITSRSLPDARDGLKPVHRRILHAMWGLKLNPQDGYKKSARIVGDVMGRFHPHGDQAIYDAMVRLAQDFSMRWLLVDGQGNFGNIDGDSAAAMRYTEARMTAIGTRMLQDIDEDTVDMKNTYDNETTEPAVLPANFPYLLANGSSGIAVGMMTSIPPHNVAEICDSLLYYLSHRHCEISDIMQFLKGPDFPTGGVIAENENDIITAYTTGRGTIRLRAKYTVEDLQYGNFIIIIHEIPYQVQKSRLIEKISLMITDKKLSMISDIRDESAEDVRIIVTPKNRTYDSDLIMQQLFQLTDLEIKFTLNFNVLTDRGRIPQCCNIKSLLQEYCTHRLEVILRRSQYRYNQLDARLEILDGYIICHDNIDRIINIIRTEDDPKEIIIQEFKLSERQADAILDMRLKSLRRLEAEKLQKERANVIAALEKNDTLINSEAARINVLRQEIRDIRKEFAPDSFISKRRTDFTQAPNNMTIAPIMMIEREPIAICLSENGWIKSLKTHQNKLEEQKFKQGDIGRFLLNCYTTDKIIIMASHGRFYALDAYQLPSGRGFGEPLNLLIDLPAHQKVITMFVYQEDKKCLIASRAGRGFIVAHHQLLAQTKNGKQIMNVKNDDTAFYCIDVDGDHVAVIGDNRRLLVFPITEIPELNKGQGVILQKYKDGGLAGLTIFYIQDGLRWSTGARNRTEKDIRSWLGRRAQIGKMPPHGFPQKDYFQ